MIFFSVIFVVQNNFIFASQNVVATQSNPNSAASQAPSNLLSAKNKKNPNDIIYVRDYKYFRVFQQGDARIVLNKTNITEPKNSTQTVVYTKGLTKLTIKKNDDIAIYDMAAEGKSKHHHLVYKFEKNKNPKVGYYAVHRTKYFNDEKPVAAVAPAAQSCRNVPSWGLSELAAIAKVLGENDAKVFTSIDVENFIDPTSCGSATSEVDNLKTSMNNLFRNNANEMFKCLQTEESQKILKNNVNLQMNANLFVARMIRFLDVDTNEIIDKKLNKNLSSKLKSNTSKIIEPMKIMCAPNKELENKVACFKDEVDAPAIIVDLKKIPKIASGELDEEALKKVLLHEFYHTAAQPIETPKNPKCIAESVVESLTALCGEKQKTLSNIEKTETCVSAAVNDVQSAGLTLNKGAQEAALEHKISTVATSAAPPPSVTDQANVAQSIAQLSQPSAIATSQLSESTGAKIVLENNSKTESFAASAFTGLAATPPAMLPAIAKVAAVTLSTPTQAAPTAGYSVDPYPKADLLKDTNSANISPSYLPEIKLASASLASEGNAVNLKATTQVVSKSESSTPQESTTLESNSTNRKPASVANEKITSAAQSNNDVASTAVVSSTSQATTKVKSPTSSGQKIAADTALVQSLTVFDKLSGEKYNQIKSQYSNKEFINLLESRGIAIELQTSTDISKKLGANKNAKFSFIDNGKTLVKVTTGK